jgi:hypothetical protein
VLGKICESTGMGMWRPRDPWALQCRRFGTVDKKRGGVDFDRKSADHSARAAIAAQISSEMEASLAMKKRVEQVGSTQNYQAMVEQDATSTSQVKLPPSTQRELWQHPDGTVFVLVTIKKKGN